MTIESSKKGKEIEKYLNGVNMDPWHYIYENYIQNNAKVKSNQTEKENNSSD
jgi:hypothetical protein